MGRAGQVFVDQKFIDGAGMRSGVGRQAGGAWLQGLRASGMARAGIFALTAFGLWAVGSAGGPIRAWGADAQPAAQAPAAAQPAPTTAELQAQQHKRDIEAEQARCTALLKGLTLVATIKDPIEEGECGALAPVELISVGKKPEVVFSPPAIVTCDLAAALAGWVKTDVQPLAHQYLSSEIARIETMSSYSCRHAYGRKRTKLSEHGRANALDIRGFVTAKGENAFVLEDWGMTSSEIAAASAQAQQEQAAREAEAARQLAAAKAAADAAKARAVAQGKAPAGTQPPASTPNPLANATTIIEGLPKATPSLGLNPPVHLGGSKLDPAAQAPAAAPKPDQPISAKSLFLRAVHDKGCLRFGTTLGPEANAEHRNHLHVDMAERKVRKICD